MSDFAEISATPTREAFRVLIARWHDMTEAGCCGTDHPFCQRSTHWARGYLAAVADAEEQMHTCAGHPNDRCDACWKTKHAIKDGRPAGGGGVSG